MRVLMFGWEYPPTITGGLGTACYGLTKGMAQTGTKIIFVVPKLFGNEDKSHLTLLDAGSYRISEKKLLQDKFMRKITFLEIGSALIPYMSPIEYEKRSVAEILETRTDYESVFSPSFSFSGQYGNNLLNEVSRYALIAAIIANRHVFDVIHAHDWLTYPAGIAAKEVTGKPLVIHVHATEFDRSGEHVNQSVFEIEKSGMEYADKVITVSNLTRRIVIEKYGIDPDKVVTVHNAVEPVYSGDSGSSGKTVPEKIVTFLGRITFQKGPEYFVEAAYKVLQKDKNVRFVMAGSGDMMVKMIKRVAELGISSNFHFAGFLAGSDVVKMFDMSDVYVMPSVSEPFGISPLEAMRSNVPVIISKQSGVSEILTHALKIDFWDIDAMADCIYGLLNYEGLAKMFRRYGKNEVDNLKWENAAKKINQIYYELTENHEH